MPTGRRIYGAHGISFGTTRPYRALLACCFAVLIAIAARVSVTAATPQKWTLAVIGDQQWAVTQETGNDYLECFTSQIEWLIANAKSVNLRMVVQVGDIVENPQIESEWERASGVMARLDPAANAEGGTGIPWSVAFGNHEIIGAVRKPTIDLAGPGPTRAYRHYFGSARGAHRYANQPEFRGVSPNDLNTWHIIKAGKTPDARSYLMLNLEIDVPGKKEGTNFDAIVWAQGIIDANPGVPTIVTTHVFEGSRAGPPDKAYLEGFGHNSQLEIFEKLIAHNSQIFLVLSGHTNERTHRIRQNAAGQPVLQMVTDYSKSVGKAGDGFFRLLTFDEAANSLHITTYSAHLNQPMTDPDSQFTFELDFIRRFALSRSPGSY